MVQASLHAASYDERQCQITAWPRETRTDGKQGGDIAKGVCWVKILANAHPALQEFEQFRQDHPSVFQLQCSALVGEVLYCSECSAAVPRLRSLLYVYSLLGVSLSVAVLRAP